MPRLNGNSLQRVGPETQKPLEVIRRRVRALSYSGSTVVNFFAGSGSTTRVAIEEGRHSIASDSSPKLTKFLVQQLRNMNVDGAELLGTSLQYKILERDEFAQHPVFRQLPFNEGTRKTGKPWQIPVAFNLYDCLVRHAAHLG